MYQEYLKIKCYRKKNPRKHDKVHYSHESKYSSCNKPKNPTQGTKMARNRKMLVSN